MFSLFSPASLFCSYSSSFYLSFTLFFSSLSIFLHPFVRIYTLIISRRRSLSFLLIKSGVPPYELHSTADTIFFSNLLKSSIGKLLLLLRSAFLSMIFLLLTRLRKILIQTRHKKTLLKSYPSLRPISFWRQFKMMALPQHLPKL